MLAVVQQQQAAEQARAEALRVPVNSSAGGAGEPRQAVKAGWGTGRELCGEWWLWTGLHQPGQRLLGCQERRKALGSSGGLVRAQEAIQRAVCPWDKPGRCWAGDQGLGWVVPAAAGEDSVAGGPGVLEQAAQLGLEWAAKGGADLGGMKQPRVCQEAAGGKGLAQLHCSRLAG